MLHASYYAGCAFTKSYVGYVHAVAHSLGGEYNIPHGLANAILLPHVLEEYGASIHKKLYKLAVSAGIAHKETPVEQAAGAFIDTIKGSKSPLPRSGSYDRKRLGKILLHADGRRYLFRHSHS